MTDVDDLVQWLREQIAAVERIASAAQAPYSGDRWEVVGKKGIVVRRWPDELRAPDVPILKAKAADIYLLHHVAMHDPATVLAQCQAHTAILDQYEFHAKLLDTSSYASYNSGWVEAWEKAVCAVGLAYQHRPGYREEWRP